MRFATVAALVGSASAAISFGPQGAPQGPPAGGMPAGSWGPGEAAGNGTVVYTTDVVTAFTTYCPEATQLTHNGQTYTITSATTLTITNCPCTVTKPVYSSVVTSCSTCSSTPAAPVSESSSPAAPVSYSSASSSPAAPVSYSSPAAPVSYSAPGNGTTVGPTAPAGTAPGSPVTTTASTPASATGSPIASYTGAATKVQVAGAGLLALFGLVAAL